MKAFSSDLSATELIDLLIAKAPELRRAGVVELSPDRVVFAPYREQRAEVPGGEPEKDDEPGVNPWNDPVGMGFDPGTKLPNFGRQVDEEDEK